MHRHLPLLSGCMKAVANVWGNRLVESLRIPFICRVFPWNTAPCTSASLPKPRRCQVTLSPSHTFSPGKLPNIIPLMAAKENAIDSLQVRDSFCAHALTGQAWQQKCSFLVIPPQDTQDTLQDSCASFSVSHLLPPASPDFRSIQHSHSSSPAQSLGEHHPMFCRFNPAALRTASGHTMHPVWLLEVIILLHRSLFHPQIVLYVCI